MRVSSHWTHKGALVRISHVGLATVESRFYYRLIGGRMSKVSYAAR